MISICFLSGNEDRHLKNFSLLVEKGRFRLAPAYDFLNSTLVLENASEESPMPPHEGWGVAAPPRRDWPWGLR